LALGSTQFRGYFLRDKGGQCLGLTPLPPSYADCLEICEPKTPGTLGACTGVYRDCFTFYLSVQKLPRTTSPSNSKVCACPILLLTVPTFT